jgi:leucyl aminopeptidase
MAPSSRPAAAPLADLLVEKDERAVPVWLASKATIEEVKGEIGAAGRAWIDTERFEPGHGKTVLIPGPDGKLAGAVLGIGSGEDGEVAELALGALAGSLPEGSYRLASRPGNGELAAAAFLMGAYRFERYLSGKPPKPRRLSLPQGARRESVLAIAESVALGRDLINTPASDMGPEELEAAARALAATHKADVSSIVGDDLIAGRLPMIHAVGRASPRAPRLVDIAWGAAKAPRITLIGKGIVFDTGGLNIKPGDSMALMKKDMGGAATALALASMIMRAKLPVRLRVLLPIAENAVSGNAFRPGDVLATRNGMTVEIGNTDAEGRLVLGDAIAVASEERPDTIITFATLTGAARVALGPDLPALFCDDDAFAAEIAAEGLRVGDPSWRMPFWAPYDKLLKSTVADVNHISSGSFAGAVTAALFLKRFVKDTRRFAHFDMFAWTPEPKPAKPKGGEPQTARALFEVFRKAYR